MALHALDFNSLLAAARSISTDPTHAVERIVMKSSYLPDTQIDNPFAPRDPGLPPGPSDAILKIIKPRIEVFVTGSTTPVVLTPYGEPDNPSHWPIVQGIGAALLGVGIATSLVVTLFAVHGFLDKVR